jgi:hypothetical protein
MTKIWDYIKHLWAEEPAVTAWALGGGLAMLVAYVFHFDHTQQAAAATIVTALAAIVVVFATKEKSVTAITGALATIIVAASAFGFHPSPHAVATILAAASIALGFLFRQNVEPVALARKRAAAAVRQPQPEPVSRHLINPQGSL